MAFTCPHYKLLLVRCPQCSRVMAQTSLSRHPLVAGWRRGRRAFAAVARLALALGTLTLAVLILFFVSSWVNDEMRRYGLWPFRFAWLDLNLQAPASDVSEWLDRVQRMYRDGDGHVALFMAVVLALILGCWGRIFLAHLPAWRTTVVLAAFVALFGGGFWIAALVGDAAVRSSGKVTPSYSYYPAYSSSTVVEVVSAVSGRIAKLSTIPISDMVGNALICLAVVAASAAGRVVGNALIFVSGDRSKRWRKRLTKARRRRSA